jgi:NRPS condensation-like uncharacterized protein
MTDPVIRETYPADLQAKIIRLTAEIGCAGPVLFVTSFEGRLDPTRLARAARLLLDAEPMLGCRFVAGPGRPYWRRRDDLDTETWCFVQETDDPDAVLRQLMTPVPEHIERTIRLHLLRGPAGDTLVMWITHMLADAYAARQCAGLLGEIYTRLRDEPGYRPETNPAPPMPDSWMRTLSFGDTLRILRRDVADAREGRGMVHSFERDFETFKRMPPAGADFVKVRIGPNALAEIDRSARQRGNTRNEMLTASFLRAFSDFAPRGPAAKAQVAMTVDLRRFAPRGPQLRTYSMVGMTRVTVPYAAGDPFDKTLAQVKAVLDRQKKALMGAANPLLVRLFDWLPPRAMQAMIRGMVRKTIDRPMAPNFSNAGRAEPDALCFDGTAPRECGVVVYPAGLPLFMVTAMEYAGTLTLTCCFQPTDLTPDAVRGFLERVVNGCPADPVVETEPDASRAAAE